MKSRIEFNETGSWREIGNRYDLEVFYTFNNGERQKITEIADGSEYNNPDVEVAREYLLSRVGTFLEARTIREVEISRRGQPWMLLRSESFPDWLADNLKKRYKINATLERIEIDRR